MKGISVTKFGGIEELILKNSLQIPKLQDNQVLVKVKSSGVNPVDTYIRAGTHFHHPSLPYIPGSDGSGVIKEVGKHVTKFKPGDRIFGFCRSHSGTLAEYCCMEETSIFPLVDQLTFDEGAALGIPYFTAYRALFYCAGGRTKEGCNILIHGASGSVGQACVQFAKAHNFKVVGTAGNSDGLKLVSSLGANAAYNHNDKDYIPKMEKEQGKFDVIIEMLANVNLQNDLTLLNRNGIVVVVGCRGDINISPRFLMGPESSITACSVLSSSLEEFRIMGEEICKGMKDGWVKPAVSKVYTLEQVGQAHHDVINNKGTFGKLVVRIQE